MQRRSKSPGKLYSQEFHADRDARTRLTAETILGQFARWTAMDSVCDVGCGVGTWLAAARDLGAGCVQGFEGPWGEAVELVVERGLIRFGDLHEPVADTRRYDLVISLEVAEHLNAARAPGFVADLCALGDVVLFSAAIPGQGGTGHVNEQWQSYWAGHFAAQGYQAHDAIRPLVWDDDQVAWWYRQNILLYVREGSPAATALAGAGLRAPVYLDLVHPAYYTMFEAEHGLRRLKRKARDLIRSASQHFDGIVRKPSAAAPNG
ncbi:hypothetical protein B2G71_20820 [Novosphingobium sp. PC22D]|uniref:class I SAM-dependent methyltransferase n=1 Tax=Novosphingobium sp. PC22D TaxID=1962403 RepID=UPI000BF1BF6A|nr:methyltransferase domain-containing protein [Novosphingobium sp. PC22D]PEQ10751.1 hypothetical protein B2G71_20820 [Novosphingobium sp. PC22D]